MITAGTITAGMLVALAACAPSRPDQRTAISTGARAPAAATSSPTATARPAGSGAVPTASTAPEPVASTSVAPVLPAKAPTAAQAAAALGPYGWAVRGLAANLAAPRPIAVAWAYPPFGSMLAGHTAAAYALAVWRWQGTGWQLAERRRIHNRTDFPYAVRTQTGPNDSLGLVVITASGGSDGAGSLWDWEASPAGLHLAGRVAGAGPVLHRLPSGGWQEVFGRHAYRFTPTADGWSVLALGLAGTIPAGAARVAWNLQDGRLTVGPLPPQVAAGRAVAFVPGPLLRAQPWLVMGPFPSAAAARAAAQTGQYSQAQWLSGMVVKPPPGRSWWLLAVWSLPTQARPTTYTVVALSVP